MQHDSDVTPINQPSPTASKPVSHRRKWRLAVSLRLLMILVAIIAIPLAWKINMARRQKEAIAIIRRAGGEVHYLDEFVDPTIPRPSPAVLESRIPGPKRLRRWLGDDYFRV